jgi:predicted  nucleic acid-binding Zn-ribbon protein
MLNEAQALVRMHEIVFGLDGYTNLTPERAEKEIELCRSEISRSVLGKYELLKNRYSAGAVLEVEDDICSGCHISLSKSTVDRLKRGLVFCDHCGRILCHPDRVYSMQH